MGDWMEIVRIVPALQGPDAYYDHPYWYNQLHLYHKNARLYGGWVNVLLADILYINRSKLPYNIEFEDGTKISKDTVYEIYDVMEQNEIHFDWQQGDILIIDNRQVLHGKTPYKGDRRILTTMIQAI